MINQIGNAVSRAREGFENIRHKEHTMTWVSSRWLPGLLTNGEKAQESENLRGKSYIV